MKKQGTRLSKGPHRAPESPKGRTVQTRRAAGGRQARDAAVIRLPRDPKGRRAQFYDDPAIDQLMAIAAALTAEVSVAFERIDTLERLLEQAGVTSHDAVEAFRPDESLAAERLVRREQLIERVFQVLSQYERRPA